MNMGLALVVAVVMSTLGPAAASEAVEPPTATSPGAGARPTGSEQLLKLEWMTGSWTTSATRDGVRTEEHWMTATGTIMMGMSRTNRLTATTFYEHLRIESREDGVYYVAQPKGQAEAEFKLVKVGEKEAIFENPAHDFPSRIIYRRTSETDLLARIEGTRGGKVTGMDIPMRLSVDTAKPK